MAIRRAGKSRWVATPRSKRRGGVTGYTRRRASYGRKRTYRKKTSRKTLLNITSRKKRNGMLGWTNTNGSGLSKPLAPGGATVSATVGYRCLWVANAMDLTEQSGNYGSVSEMASRTSTTCYMKGLAENIRIQTSSNIPWFWRRICFTFKGLELRFLSPLDTPVDTNFRYTDTTNGIERLLFNENVNNQTNTINNNDSIIFKGAKGIDWTDTMLAPVDTARVSLKYDKTLTFQTGNDRGILKEFKLYHPMGHNITYGDDESGDGMISSYFSVNSKQGMGDFYVMDIIGSGLGGTSSDLLNFFTSSTLYWHEK